MSETNMSRLDTPKPWLKKALAHGHEPETTEEKLVIPLAPSPDSILQERYNQRAKRAARKELRAKRAERKARHAASIAGC